MAHVKTPSVELVGTSPAVEALRRAIRDAARCDAKVLLTGESGVGKEVAANLIHAGSSRCHARLVTVNCAAIAETLLETELFGHVRGSFTGAFRDRPGLFELAHRGTVFIDEIGETSPRMQGMLLRFLESGEVQRVGSDRPHTVVNVRVIAATNRVLADSVASGAFREDLYYRLNVIRIVVPPLRERRDDIPALLQHFLRQFTAMKQVRVPTLSTRALTALCDYHWPGNIRELKNLIERLVARGIDGEIALEDLPPEINKDAAAPAPAPVAAVPAGSPLAHTLYERVVIRHEDFWECIHATFMSRDMTRADLRAIVERGLTATGGNYRLLVELFGMPPSDYKRFLSFLRKYECHVPFQQFRTSVGSKLSPDQRPRGPALRLPA
jgi:two-component system, NtrC family, response regulator HydG